MSVTVSQLAQKIVIQGDTEAKAKLAGMSSSANSAGGALRSFALGAAVLAGTALIGIGVASTKMAADFQSSMTSLVTGAGEAQSNMQMVSDGILNMAPAVGTTTKQLADGMYMIESAGFHGADGLNVLKNAAEGAKVGNAQLKDVANGVTTALTDYHLPALEAAEVTNDLIATVANGKTTMQQLSTSLKNILPVASSAGISLRDVSGAMSTMTGEGVPAGQSATYLKTMILALEAPSSKGATALKNIGLSAQDVATAMKTSLPSAIQMVTDHLKTKFPEGSAAYTAALKDITGGSSALSAVLDLTGSHMSTFKSNVTSISDAVNKGQDSINGWSKVQGDFNFQVDKGKEVVETMGIKLGTALLPKVGELLSKIMPTITQFGNWLLSSHALENAFTFLAGAITGTINVITNIVTFFQNNKAAFETLKIATILLAGVFAGALVGAMILATIAAWNMAIAFLANPIVWIAIAIGAAIALIVVAIMHWGDIVKWLQGIWGAFSGWFMGILGGIGAWFTGLWQGLANWFTGMWTGIIKGLIAAWNFIINVIKIGALLALAVIFAPFIAIAALFIWLYNHNYYFKALVDAIVNFFKGCFTWLQGAWTDTINWLVGAWNDTVNFATNLWNQVSGAIKTGFSAAIGFVAWIWGVISSFFVNAWNTYIAKPLTSLWQNVSNVFSSAWTTYIAGPIGSLWNTLSTTVGGWATNALDWGKNLIQSFIDGIKNKAAEIGGALADTAQKIANFLGFHSPTKEGPGQEADKWAPNFVKMYSSGLKAGLPQIEGAVSNLIKPIAMNLRPALNTGLTPGALSSGVSLAPIGVSNQQPIIIHNYIDGKQITNNVGPRMIKSARTNGPLRSGL